MGENKCLSRNPACEMNSIQPTVLIVDDEKHTRDGLRRLLEDDYDVYVAAGYFGLFHLTLDAQATLPAE